MSVLLRSTPRASLPRTDREGGGGGETQGVDEDKKRKHGDSD